MKTLTLTTLLYEGNKDNILRDDSWFFNFNNSLITKKVITVNNVKNRAEIEVALKRYPNIGYFFVDDCEKDAKNFFSVDISKENTIGYYYIIPYFCMVYKSQTDFILNVSDDCATTLEMNEDYMKSSMEEIMSSSPIISTTLSWGMPKSSFGYDVGQYEEMETFRIKQRSENSNAKFWQTAAFSDQIFMIETEFFKTIDYNLPTRNNVICKGTPYCPNSWERMVGEYLWQNNLYRGVWKDQNQYYRHGY